jgi:hypothetical protein
MNDRMNCTHVLPCLADTRWVSDAEHNAARVPRSAVMVLLQPINHLVFLLKKQQGCDAVFSTGLADFSTALCVCGNISKRMLKFGLLKFDDAPGPYVLRHPM